ncbi:MAG: CoA pyrophosphatase [Balneolaceae bacterium]|nr:CoA pyrophosphatase [Balneolaceae bacterium]MCH8548975.1 CoA pyrophosphatase [Balneolaceae bacterium]
MLRDRFLSFLKNRISGPLPGREAQQKLQPTPMAGDYSYPEMRDDAHPSSVAILLFEKEHSKLKDLHVILTLRTDSIRHGGQISFPGGRSDNNETLEETALRETEEEIGITRDEIHLIGSITPLYLSRSNNQITPFIAFLEEEPEPKPNPDEVEEVFSVPLSQLLHDATFVREKWDLSHASFEVPYWNVHTTPLWGATAMIMSEFLELYREFLNETD